jgi:hypothetical protein
MVAFLIGSIRGTARSRSCRTTAAALAGVLAVTLFGPFSSPTAYAAERGSPFDRRREVAIAATFGLQAKGRLMEALNDSDSHVRYWGATGLGMLGPAAKDAAESLARALYDESPSVRVAAARALVQLGYAERAVPILARELKGEQEWARLAAAQALDELGQQARPALPALEGAAEDSNDYVVRVVTHALGVLKAK